MGIEIMLNYRRDEYAEILERLIQAKPARFDATLPTVLPKAHGLYAISTIDNADTEYLHVGKTKMGRDGLLGRIWVQHYVTGGSQGDLIEKVRVRELFSAPEAQAYISQKCEVRWLVVDDKDLRGWAEHYILALRRPIWCS